jgi:hypothetical protein
MFKRIAAIVPIFLGCTLAWAILGSTVLFRTNVGDKEIKEKVRLLWGEEHRQPAPRITYTIQRAVQETYTECNPDCVEKKKTVTVDEPVVVPLESSDVDVDLRYEPRRKGLFWYSTYQVGFEADYLFKNRTGEARTYTVVFYFPSAEAQYDDFSCRGKEGEIDYSNQQGFISFDVELEPGRSFPFTVAYNSRGIDSWRYFLDGGGNVAYGDVSGQVSEVKNFTLTMTTDFDAIDFPTGSMSPGSKNKTPGGWEVTWSYRKLISGLNIGMAMPEKLNPGPLSSRITFFAPVSLLFFFFLLFIITVMRKVDLHPMHFFFLGASFFAFHLLFAYLVDHVSVHVAFAASAVTSIVLVISYIRIVAGWRFALLETSVLQLLYLVIFSYTHFFKGYTGLIVTVFSILTLFVIMQFTARVRWTEVFASKETLEVRQSG